LIEKTHFDSDAKSRVEARLLGPAFVAMAKLESALLPNIF
jgi:hypothetical protein